LYSSTASILTNLVAGASTSRKENEMALFEDVFEGGIGTGVAVAGAVVLAPTVLPALARLLRPVAKAAIKGGLVLYRETLAGVGDVAGDLIAEARAELEADDKPDAADRPARRRGGAVESAG
jgi:hypothetical protein